MRIFGFLPAFLAAQAAAAPVGVPAGCKVAATLVSDTCEMHQVLDCESGEGTRVDVYLGGRFLGEEVYNVTTMTRWRRGAFVQELEFEEGAFDHLASMPEGETREIDVTRLRNKIGTEGGPPPSDFTYRIAVQGPAIRELSEGDREIRRYIVTVEGAGAEGGEYLIDYDPALGLPVWRQGTARAADGTTQPVDTGPLTILMPGAPGYMEDTAPGDSACIPE